MSFLIKICGVTRLGDALEAAALGADALGFMFYEGSPRHLSVAEAAEICRESDPRVRKVGVFVDASARFIEAAAAECGLDFAQLHGEESPEFCAGIDGVEVIKAFRVANAGSLARIAEYRTAFWLLDSAVPGKPGGTGTTFNWELAGKARGAGAPFLLAGGLTPENVAEAVRVARPDGVDVSSGVESEPGRKDRERMKGFIDAARAAALAWDQEGLPRLDQEGLPKMDQEGIAQS
jgi:phosphoribosylanthranilate isomerase